MRRIANLNNKMWTVLYLTASTLNRVIKSYVILMILNVTSLKHATFHFNIYTPLPTLKQID